MADNATTDQECPVWADQCDCPDGTCESDPTGEIMKMRTGRDEMTLSAEELNRLIGHLRKKDQSFIENIGGGRREVRTDDCLVADYLEAMRAELPKWQCKEENQNG